MFQEKSEICTRYSYNQLDRTRRIYAQNKTYKNSDDVRQAADPWGLELHETDHNMSRKI